jgi:protein-S-isoprenylcysteine O-methyltransferase Ste14
MTALTPAGRGSAGTPRSPPPRHWLYRLRATRGFDLVSGVIGGTFFLVLAISVGLGAWSKADALHMSRLGEGGYLDLLSSVCMVVYYLTLWWLMLSRPLPIARTGTVLPSLVAFTGTYLPCLWILFASGNASKTQHLVSATLVLTGSVLMVVVIEYLGHSFSIVPQARKLVRTGPYALVRNPLYLVEQVAQLGYLVIFFSPWALALFVAVGSLQVCRITYEENLLRGTFPDYDAYAKSTPRLIPFVW